MSLVPVVLGRPPPKVYVEPIIYDANTKRALADLWKFYHKAQKKANLMAQSINKLQQDYDEQTHNIGIAKLADDAAEFAAMLKPTRSNRIAAENAHHSYLQAKAYRNIIAAELKYMRDRAKEYDREAAELRDAFDSAIHRVSRNY